MSTAQIDKETERRFHKAQEQVEEVLTDALCETYRRLTGKEASDRLADQFREAVRFNT
jgi:phage gp36-like protein